MDEVEGGSLDSGNSDELKKLIEAHQSAIDQGLVSDEEHDAFVERIAPLITDPCRQACLNAYNQCIAAGNLKAVCTNQYTLCLANCV